MTEHDHSGGTFELNEHAKQKQQEVEQLIQQGIEAAQAEDRIIDHRTARLIAEQLHGPDSPLQWLAVSGEVCPELDGEDEEDQSDGVLTELTTLVGAVPKERQPWLEAMAGYALAREDEPDPIRGWQHLTSDPEDERRESSSPKIFVISLDDCLAGVHCGEWIEADQDPEELQAAIDTILERSTMPEAVAWEIFDHSGFGGIDVFTLVDDGDPESTLEVVSRVGLGVAEHGPAFAAYIHTLGTSQEVCDQFERRYLGRWHSAVAYAEHVADDLAWYSHLDTLPEWMRDYVTLDYAKLAGHMADELTVVDGPGGRVYIFGPE